MNAKLIINSIGILLNIIGAYIIFVNSPLHFTVIYGGNASTDWNEIDRKTKKRNAWVRYGVYVLIAGSVLQLISNFLS